MTSAHPSRNRSAADRICRQLTAITLTLLAAWPLAGPARSQEPDYHSRFESECGRCHGHSGPFARASLEIVDGRLVGRATGAPVEQFLQRHPGGLAPADIARFGEVLRRQVEAGGVFSERCAICHGRAVELAAANLAVRDGVLLIRYSGVPVRDYLATHGRLDARDIDIVHRALQDIAARR